MSEKRYYNFLDDKQEWVIRDRTNRRNEFRVGRNKGYAENIVALLNEQQSIIKQLEEDKAIAEDYANIFEMENVKLRKKLNKYKATVLGFIWMMEQNGRISGKDDKIVKDLFKELENE